MSNPVILYDIASKDGNHCFSPNPWKTRMLLNYKGIPYRTIFLEFPDIAPTLSSLQLEPNTVGSAYTVPTITLSDGVTHVMESSQIASVLEREYPIPTVHLTHPSTARAQAIWDKVVPALSPATAPRVMGKLLSSRSKEFFVKAREAAPGMTPQELELRMDERGDGPWIKAKEGFEDWVALLGEMEGPFATGMELGYADVLLVGYLKYLERVDGEVLERALQMDGSGRIRRQWEACQEWVQRGSY